MMFPLSLALRLTVATACAISAAGCSSTLTQRAQNADGMLGFIFGSPGPDVVPVERISKAGGEIATAHAVADGPGLRVSGLVRKAGLHQPSRGSHIDVLVIDARGATTAAVATDYFPRPIPRQHSRGSMGNSHYAVRLPSLPPAGSTVRVIFHGTSKAECHVHRESTIRGHHQAGSTARAETTAAMPTASLLSRAVEATYFERHYDPKASASFDEMARWPRLSPQDARVRAGWARATRLLPVAKKLAASALRELLQEHQLSSAETAAAVARIARVSRVAVDEHEPDNAFVCPFEPETIFVGTVFLAAVPSDEGILSLLAHEVTHVANGRSEALAPLFQRLASRAREATGVARLKALRAEELGCELVAVKVVQSHIASTLSFTPRTRRAARAIAHNCVDHDVQGHAHLSPRTTMRAVFALEPGLAREILGERVEPLRTAKTGREKL